MPLVKEEQAGPAGKDTNDTFISSRCPYMVDLPSNDIPDVDPDPELSEEDCPEVEEAVDADDMDPFSEDED